MFFKLVGNVPEDLWSPEIF